MAIIAAPMPAGRHLTQADPGPVGPYARALAALDEAVAAIDTGDARRRRAAIQSAAEALTSLYLDLDLKRHGQRVEALAELYGHLIGRLLRANLYADRGILRHVIELLETLGPSGDTLDALAAGPRPAPRARLAAPPQRSAA